MKYISLIITLTLLSGCSTMGYVTYEDKQHSIAYDYAVRDISLAEYYTQMAILDFNEREDKIGAVMKSKAYEDRMLNFSTTERDN